MFNIQEPLNSNDIFGLDPYYVAMLPPSPLLVLIAAPVQPPLSSIEFMKSQRGKPKLINNGCS